MLRSARQAGSSLSLAALFLVSLQAYAQQSDANKPADVSSKTDEQVVKLSPFKVTTDKDKGYRATNSTSGTRLDSEIKDLPMPIEVITEQFIKDIGANDLRQSLQYSAGIQLQTQNDWGSQGTFGNQGIPGRINNPEAATANVNQSVFKIRGFDTEATLRDGFRRQNSTDSVNIARIEVIRGPNALLYGVGNFGGVVNYLIKQPETKASGSVGVELGSYAFKRATIDYTGPISDTVSYRVTAAEQATNDYTQYAKENHWFVAPIIKWTPFVNTEILIDTEYGKQNKRGIGFQNIRAVPSGYVNDGAGYDGAFLTAPGQNPKTFRWSGQDTYNNSEAYNIELKLTQKITDNLNFSTGFNTSSFKYDQLDVAASLQAAGTGTPAWAIANVSYIPLVSGQQGISTTPQKSTIGYQWAQSNENDKHYQVRSDLTYTKTLFEGSKWFKVENTLVLGQSYTAEKHANNLWDTANDKNNFHNPGDFKPFRFGFQPDGSPDAIMVPYTFQKDVTQDAASYAIYQGKFLDQRLTLIAGLRKDRSWNKDDLYSPQWNAAYTGHNNGGPSATNWTSTYSTPSKDTTHQYGADLRLTRDGSLSVFVMSAEAVSPNYQGAKDFNLNPLQASLGKDKEVGLKFDFLQGRVSGTISKFQIDRTRVGIGTIGAIWWAPTNSSQNKFNPSKDIVYQVNDVNPVTGIVQYDWADSNSVKAIKSVAPQWNAAVAAGAIYQATNSNGDKNWYVDASKTAGATYMDALFAAQAANKGGYFGWLWNNDNLTNGASLDAQNNHGQQSVPLGADRSTGWDGQIMFSPTDDLQIYASFSHVDKVVVHAGQWITYPYPQDRWALWYAPGYILPAGQGAAQAYTNPADTSTLKVYGDGLPLDDTPKNQGSVWVHYQLPKTSGLHGLHFGVGAVYQGPGALYPIFSRQQYDANGNMITLNTKAKTLYNGMVRYEFKVKGREASVQLNVDNLANNTDYSGFIANPPRKWSLTYNQKL